MRELGFVVAGAGWLALAGVDVLSVVEVGRRFGGLWAFVSITTGIGLFVAPFAAGLWMPFVVSMGAIIVGAWMAFSRDEID